MALTLSATGGALAQNASFTDVPQDSYAAEAVAELVELGIVTGFPDGTFRGNEAFTRYQAALVVSRLLDVIDENVAAAGALSEEDLATVNNAVQELSNELGALDERVAALEAGGGNQAQLSDEVAALSNRLGALEEAGAAAPQVGDQLATLEERVAALEAAPAAAPGAGEEVTALQEQVTALNNRVNELSSQLEAAQLAPAAAGEAAEAVTEAVEPDVDLAAPAAVAVAGERGKFYLGLGAFNELNDRVRPRVTLGVDNVIGGLGLRATADYGRQSLIEEGAVTAAGHLTYTLGASLASAYLGVGGGYQFSDLIFDSSVTEGPFAGALLGAEFGSGPLTFFVEGMADYYFDTLVSQDDPATVGVDYPYDQLYPTVAVGLNFRP